MNLPEIITALVQAQNNSDHNAYANCFGEAAIVHDEGHTYHGKDEIREWIKEANVKYASQMEPLDYEQSGPDVVMATRVSGTFAGSPAILKYHMQLADGLIRSLKVTG